MNYWETVAGQELLNLIRMEVSRYSARKQYTNKVAKFRRNIGKGTGRRGKICFVLPV